MKNASTLKTNNTESPKTPGGISKSLLTPCRRLGLSRNWKKSGPPPFISPLANSSDGKQEKVESRKRKEQCLESELTQNLDLTSVNDIIVNVITDLNNTNTPSRNVDLPRKKKSKTLITTIHETEVTVSQQSPIKSDLVHKNVTDEHNKIICEFINTENEDVSTPSKTKNIKNVIASTSIKEKQNVKRVEQNLHKEAKIINDKTPADEINEHVRNENKSKERRPNDLKKECMIVLQKKIFKTGLIVDQKQLNSDNSKTKTIEPMTQELFDSDSDDIPLNNLTPKPTELSHNSEDDFETKSHTRKRESKNLSKTKDISKKLKNPKVISKPKTTCIKIAELSNDDDDDFAETKKTIIVRKTYAKVSKPSKAKSTGSITQKDIDELKSRIEVKKKLLLAKAMSEDTKELRDLIKKWQKGCQDALIELMDLMKNKFPDKSNMDYSEILETLKIPALLVGYNADEDCFNTPDDTSIILASLNE